MIMKIAYKILSLINIPESRFNEKKYCTTKYFIIVNYVQQMRQHNIRRIQIKFSIIDDVTKLSDCYIFI